MQTDIKVVEVDLNPECRAGRHYRDETVASKIIHGPRFGLLPKPTERVLTLCGCSCHELDEGES